MYEPTIWVDGKSPDINEDNLNNIEQGIKAAHDMAEHNAANIAAMAGNQMPVEYLKAAVDDYVKNNSGGFATQVGMEELESQLTGQIESATSSLNSDIVDYCNVRKCFNETNLHNGFLNVDNGQIIDNAVWKCTDFIPCEVYDRVLGAITNGMNLVAFCFYDSNKRFLYSAFSSTTSTDRLPIEHIVTNKNTKYVRYNVVPTSWLPYSEQYLDIVSGEIFRKGSGNFISSFTQYSTSEQVTNGYNSLENLPINSIFTYTINSLGGLVSSKLPFAKGFTIMTYNSITNALSGAVQIATDLLTGQSKTRVYRDGVWTSWSGQEINATNVVYYVGASRSGENTFTTLKACTEYIIINSIYNATVYVDAETFDLANEFGTDYLESISSEKNKGFGLKIGNNTHFIFAEGSKVLFNYQGTNEDCAEYFSAFNVYGSFTLENANVEVTNARYCVHEDLPTSAETMPISYIAKYINCTMKHNGNNFGSYTGTVCIGAGTYKNSLSIFYGGKYECGTQFPYAISYHNYSGTLPSRVVFKNVWVNNGIRLANFGTSQVDVEISGCYIPNGYTQGSYFDVTAWNNTINQ